MSMNEKHTFTSHLPSGKCPDGSRIESAVNCQFDLVFTFCRLIISSLRQSHSPTRVKKGFHKLVVFKLATTRHSFKQTKGSLLSSQMLTTRPDPEPVQSSIHRLKLFNHDSLLNCDEPQRR
jgi:hypothetical protein